MLTRRIVIQLIVFVVVGGLAVGYTAMRYAGIGSSVLSPTYTVRLELPSSGGLFTNSEVTYRGFQVGKVTGMQLTPAGLEVDMRINDSAPKIPSDLKANVADRSAVGEQYVNLVPNTANGPYLADGSVIGVSQTTIPLATQVLLQNLDSLANSVPTQSLQTVVDQLDDGFHGTGPDLQKLLDSVSDFTATAQQQLPQTEQLLNSSQTVLNTQNDEAGAIESFSGSLEQLSAQLKASDPDIRNLIATAPQAATQLTDLLNETGPQLGTLIANLLTTANVLETRTAGIEQALVTYPLLAGASQTTFTTDGQARLGFVLNFFNPAPCTAGYQGTQMRPGNVTTQAPLNTNAYCAASSGSGEDVRGAQNAPYGGSPGGAASSSGSAQSTPSAPAAGPAPLSGSPLAAPGIGQNSMAQLLGVG
jgi:phospholipid/cholesterol/gamma-HCH transport system substrate-binding protein